MEDAEELPIMEAAMPEIAPVAAPATRRARSVDAAAEGPPPPAAGLRRARSTPTGPPVATRTIDFDAILAAAQRGDSLEVRLALETGLPVNFEDYWSRTLLYAACLCGHEALVRYLLKVGATDDPLERRCSKNALSQAMIRLLEPMYEAEELRIALDIDDDLTLTVPRPGVTVRVHQPEETGTAWEERKEPENLDEVLAAMAQALNIEGANLDEVRVALAAEASATELEALAARKAVMQDLVGSLPGGRLIPRSEYDRIDWGSWPVRYARWLLEKPERVRQYQDKRASQAYFIQQYGTTVHATHAGEGENVKLRRRTRILEKRARVQAARDRREAVKAAQEAAKAARRFAPRKRRAHRAPPQKARSVRLRRLPLAGAPGVLVDNGIVAPRMFRPDPESGIGVAPRAAAVMSDHVLDEHFASRIPKARVRTQGRWYRRGTGTKSGEHSRAHQKGKKPRIRARNRDRDAKREALEARW